jgi:hypothetical protein
MIEKLETIIPALFRNHWVGDGFSMRLVFVVMIYYTGNYSIINVDYGGPRVFTSTMDK